ncbi:DUF262 domain-containing protein [Hymenobacter crusticola]|uniref:DUF262 domain-containing protein n=1 Tax=Hymenobacter crusticola TaxID=1770526 RepID=A0A243W6C8_9BACT|nr:DUF262 domain-containing protein [Hymenobacter crusticola]OUJ69896.1 hypothetical protein BXP70_25875 [Hymenobacter crusticola]
MPNNVYSVAQIFNERLFVIPDYQRGYAWREKQCEELMEDIELLPSGKEHYTGTLVLHPQPTEPAAARDGKTYHYFHVVDGQQRLTTLTILLRVLRQAILDNGDEELAMGIAGSFLSAKRKSTTAEPLYKLTLNQDCRDFFVANILNQQPDLLGERISSHTRLARARAYFEKYFTTQQTQLNADEYTAWLEEIHDKVTQKLKVSLYEVDTAADVGVIFEVMNNRGKSLSELEKVKNYLLYLTSKLEVSPEAAKGLTDRINEAWRVIFETLMAARLGGEREDQLLRAHWFMACDPSKKDWNGSNSIKSRYSLKKYPADHSGLYADVEQYVESLQNSALAFADIEAPSRTDAFNNITDVALRQRIRQWSIRLRRLGTTASFWPLLLACRLRYHRGSEAANYAALAEVCEKYAFRVYSGMVKRRADTGQAALFRLAHRLYTKQASFESVEYSVKESLAYYSNNTAFRASLALDEDETEYSYWWSALRYFLYEYEEHLLAKAGNPMVVPWEDFSNRDLSETIEHILPQTPTNKYWTSRFTPRQRKRYIHNLGNLCLTFNNSAYSNHGFDVKKDPCSEPHKCYAHSVLAQERELAKQPEWTPATIDARRARLVEWALTRWAVPGLPEEVAEEVLEEEADN